MKITAIKAQVKNSERVSVHVDGKYAFSLTQNQLLEQKIRIGLELDQARLDELKKASETGKLYDRLLGYVLLRPRSVREVEDYCRRKRFNADTCQQIIPKLQTRGYLNDAVFARAWVENRRLTKAISERRLRLELKQKGISDEIIAAAIGQSEYSQAEALKALITKKRRQPRYQDNQKLMQYLVRQGFGYDDVKAALAIDD
jgi:regulatory protein